MQNNINCSQCIRTHLHAVIKPSHSNRKRFDYSHTLREHTCKMGRRPCLQVFTLARTTVHLKPQVSGYVLRKILFQVVASTHF